MLGAFQMRPIQDARRAVDTVNMNRRIKRLFLTAARIRPSRQIALGYGLYMLFGWFALMLPVSHAGGAGILDHLFTAVSAVSTTGLTTTPTGDTYTLFGEMVILLLIQIGGIGYMTAGSFVVLAHRKRLPAFRERVGRAVFTLPDGITVASLVRGAMFFTLFIEAAGATALYFAFRDAGSTRPLWDAVFHSVSAFCTAGFGLYGDSMESFRSHVGLNMILSVLSLLGAIGFIVMLDLLRRMTGLARRTTVTTRIILFTTPLMIAIATLLIFLDEPLISGLPPHQRLMAAFFQAMSASTTVGFNTVPIGSLSRATTVVLLILMVVGASPAGTGGGIKVTSLTALLSVVWATLRGTTDARFLGHSLPLERIRAAMSNLIVYQFALVIGVYLLTLTESASLEDLAFEAASAIGTVGLSRGVTGSLSPLGKLVVIALMYVGRVGPVMLGASLLAKESNGSNRNAPENRTPEDVAV